MSLLGRNVGIEIGQVVVILVMFPALFLLRRTSWYRPVLQIGSAVLALLSLGWMIERVFEIDLGTDGLVDQVVDVPRGYAVAAALTIVALVVYRIEAGRQRLLPVYRAGSSR